jgi:hypothetical protein
MLRLSSFLQVLFEWTSGELDAEHPSAELKRSKLIPKTHSKQAHANGAGGKLTLYSTHRRG